jgi:hypothetical protein
MGGMDKMISYRQADLINTFIGPTEVYIYVTIGVRNNQHYYRNQGAGNKVLEQEARIAIMMKPNNEKACRSIASFLEVNWAAMFPSHGVEYVKFPYSFNLRSHTTIDENSLKSILVATLNQIQDMFKTKCDYKYYEKEHNILATITFDFKMVDVELKK